MPNQNKKRLIQNITLITIVVALGSFLWVQKLDKHGSNHLVPVLYDKSIGDEVTEVLIHVKGRSDILLKDIDDVWTVVQPEKFVADTEQVQHLFTILSEDASSSYDLKDKDLVQYGLDEDRLSIRFNTVKLIFGEYNSVSQKRFIRKADKMYLVSETVTGLLQAGLDTFRIKNSPSTTDK